MCVMKSDSFVPIWMNVYLTRPPPPPAKRRKRKRKGKEASSMRATSFACGVPLRLVVAVHVSRMKFRSAARHERQRVEMAHREAPL